jgi:hypothetical protein
MTDYRFTEKSAFESYKNFKKKVDEGVRMGLLEREEAYRILKDAKKNYKSLRLNREIDRGNV